MTSSFSELAKSYEKKIADQKSQHEKKVQELKDLEHRSYDDHKAIIGLNIFPFLTKVESDMLQEQYLFKLYQPTPDSVAIKFSPVPGASANRVGLEYFEFIIQGKRSTNQFEWKYQHHPTLQTLDSGNIDNASATPEKLQYLTEGFFKVAFDSRMG